MRDEDRQRTLELYDDIFNEVGNETAVLQMLVSPTRQAVNLARAYDGKDHAIQTEEDIPPHLLVIEDLRRQANSLTPEGQKTSQDQLSLFEEPDEAENVFENLTRELDEMEDEPKAEPRREIGAFPDEDITAPQSEQPADPDGKGDVDSFSDAVDEFLSEFSISHNLNGAPDEEEEEAEPARKVEPVPTPIHDPVPARRRVADIKPVIEMPEEPAKTKAIVPLLILYILLAIPVGLVCCCALLALAAVVLALAVVVIRVGIEGLIAAFSFSVFADILLVFGLALVLTAIGLLLAWTVVWLLFGAIPGVVRGLCALGKKLCYKEVAI